MHKAPAAKITKPEPNVTINTPRDPNTLSNYNNFITTHTAVDFRIDFEKQRLTGNLTLDLKSTTNAETDEIVLDTSHLQIDHVAVKGQSSTFSVASRFEPYGSPLSIKMEKGVPKDEHVQLSVRR